MRSYIILALLFRENNSIMSVVADTRKHFSRSLTPGILNNKPMNKAAQF